MKRTAQAVFVVIFLGGCIDEGGSDLQSWETRRQRDVYPGAGLPTTYNNVIRHGDTLSYKGPAQGGCVSYGPYGQVSGRNVTLIPSIDFAVDFIPHTWRSCHKRDWKNECVGWDTHDHDYSLVVDVTGLASGSRFSAEKIYQNSPNRTIPRHVLEFDPLRFESDQDVTGVEVRICRLVTNELTADVHNVTLEWVWDEEVCDDPVRCPTPAAVAEFIRSVRDNLPNYVRHLFSDRGYYYLAKKSEHSSACLIKTLESRPEVADLAQGLIARFANTFGKPYLPETYDCTTGSTLDIASESCPETDQTEMCQAVRSYHVTRAWFQTQKDEIAKRLASDTVRASQDLQAELIALLAATETAERN